MQIGDVNGEEASVFDPDGIYHTRLMADHETLMDYLNDDLPVETSQKMMRVNRPNHWNRNQSKGIEFLRKLRLTQVNTADNVARTMTGS